MAKIKLGATLADARNAAGGIVYSKNQFGAYVRQKVSPVQPRSPRQCLARAQTQHLANYWANSLTSTQRLGWISLAQANKVIDVFGDEQTLTGLQFFVRVNRNLRKMGYAQMDNPPANQTVSALLTLSVTADVSDSSISVAFTPDPSGANHHVVIWCTPQLPQGRAFAQNFLKLVDITGPNVASPFNIYSTWTARYGTLTAGPKLVVEACLLNDTNGAESAVLQASCTITA